jgi:hypothetical protein
MNRLPKAWTAPPQVRDLREVVRHRAKLVAIRSNLKSRVHAVLAKRRAEVPHVKVPAKRGSCLM